jgi:predicted nucleic acid-binding protein
MIDPAWGPFLFDTSAESWLARSPDPPVRDWLNRYLQRHQVHISVVTLIERIRGYALLWREAAEARRRAIEAARLAYLDELGRVWPLDVSIAVIGGELLALLPHPPTPPRRSHRLVESKQDRLARWRFDILIAATALALEMRLIHNNA